jgi:hypothetical protein
LFARAGMGAAKSQGGWQQGGKFHVTATMDRKGNIISCRAIGSLLFHVRACQADLDNVV